MICLAFFCILKRRGCSQSQVAVPNQWNDEDEGVEFVVLVCFFLVLVLLILLSAVWFPCHLLLYGSAQVDQITWWGDRCLHSHLAPRPSRPQLAPTWSPLTKGKPVSLIRLEISFDHAWLAPQTAPAACAWMWAGNIGQRQCHTQSFPPVELWLPLLHNQPEGELWVVWPCVWSCWVTAFP